MFFLWNYGIDICDPFYWQPEIWKRTQPRLSQGTNSLHKILPTSTRSFALLGFFLRNLFLEVIGGSTIKIKPLIHPMAISAGPVYTGDWIAHSPLVLVKTCSSFCGCLRNIEPLLALARWHLSWPCRTKAVQAPSSLLHKAPHQCLLAHLISSSHKFGGGVGAVIVL